MTDTFEPFLIWEGRQLKIFYHSEVIAFVEVASYPGGHLTPCYPIWAGARIYTDMSASMDSILLLPMLMLTMR